MLLPRWKKSSSLFLCRSPPPFPKTPSTPSAPRSAFPSRTATFWERHKCVKINHTFQVASCGATAPPPHLFPLYLQNFHSLATYLSQCTSTAFLDVVSDFHLLLFLVTNEVMPLRVSPHYRASSFLHVLRLVLIHVAQVLPCVGMFSLRPFKLDLNTIGFGAPGLRVVN